MRKNQKEICILLHDIRSTHNVGSIFRTADALGVSKIFLSGYTPCPTDRFGRPQKEIAKTALGAQLSIPWEYQKNPQTIISKMKKSGADIIGIEQSGNSVDYKKVKVKRQTLFIVGNEVGGIDKKILSKCDAVAEIPMRGKKESLNVAVALGVALFRILNI